MGLFDVFRSFNLDKNYSRETLMRIVGRSSTQLFDKTQANFLKDGYEGSPDVYSIIKRIKDCEINIPFKIERKQGSDWVVVEDTEVHALMAAPNKTKGYTWDDINEMIDVYYLSTGNAYLYGIKPIGFSKVSEIDVIPSHLVEVCAKGDFFTPKIDYKLVMNGFKQDLDLDSVSHIRQFNPYYKTVKDSLIGLSPIQVAAMLVQSGNDRLEAGAYLLQNKGISGMITDKSDRPMTPTQREEVQSDFDGISSKVSKFGKIIVTNKDLSYIQMAMSAQDLQILEKGVIDMRTLCNVYGVNSRLFNDPENQSYNNMKEAVKALYTDAVIPLRERKLYHFNQFIVKPILGENFRMVSDYSDVDALQEDFHEKAKTYTMLKTSGIITANEASEALGFGTHEEENADKLLVSTTIIENIDENRI